MDRHRRKPSQIARFLSVSLVLAAYVGLAANLPEDPATAEANQRPLLEEVRRLKANGPTANRQGMSLRDVHRAGDVGWETATKIEVRFLLSDKTGGVALLAVPRIRIKCLTDTGGRDGVARDWFFNGQTVHLRSSASPDWAHGIRIAIGKPDPRNRPIQFVGGRRYRVDIAKYDVSFVLIAPADVGQGDTAVYEVVISGEELQRRKAHQRGSIIVTGSVGPTAGGTPFGAGGVSYFGLDGEYRCVKVDGAGRFEMRMRALGGTLFASAQDGRRGPRFAIQKLQKREIALPRDADRIFDPATAQVHTFRIPPGIPAHGRIRGMAMLPSPDSPVPVNEVDLNREDGRLFLDKGGAVEWTCWPGRYWVQLRTKPRNSGAKLWDAWDFGWVTVPDGAKKEEIQLPMPEFVK